MPTTSELPDLVERMQPLLARIAGPHHRGTTAIAWSTPGTWLTTARAVAHADEVAIALPDGSSARAEVVGRDHGLDLGLVRVADGASPPVSLGWRDPASLRVGEPVLTLARPGETVRAALAVLGVIGTRVRLPGGRSLEHYLELDRDLPRGFSGGLVLDQDGAAVGIAARGFVRGSALALPSNDVQRVVEQLARHGRVLRGYIGVGVHPVRLTSDLAERLGQRIATVVVGLDEDGPARHAGVRLGDIMLALDGNPLSSPHEFRAVLSERSDQDVTLTILRAGDTAEIQVHTGTRA